MRRWLSRGASGGGGGGGRSRSGEARLHWNKALSTLVAWRATHRARAAAYLVPAGGSGRLLGPGGRERRRAEARDDGRDGELREKRNSRRRESGSASGDENAAPTPPTVLSRPPPSDEEEEENEELSIRASFNKLMDGRIARTRASSIDGIGSRGGGNNLSDLFPEAA